MDKTLGEVIISKEELMNTVKELKEKGYDEKLVINFFKALINTYFKNWKNKLNSDLKIAIANFPNSEEDTIKFASIMKTEEFMHAILDDIMFYISILGLKRMFKEAGIYDNGQYFFSKINGFENIVNGNDYPDILQLRYKIGDKEKTRYIIESDLRELLGDIGISENSYTISLDEDYHSMKSGLLFDRESAIRELGGSARQA